MELTNANQSTDLLTWINRPMSRVVLLGLAIFLFLILIDDKIHGWGLSVYESFVTTSFYIGIIYINYNFLLPRLTKRGSVFTYLLFIGLLAALLTPMKSLLLFIAYKIFLPELGFTEFPYKDIFLGLLVVGVVSSVFKVFTDWLQQQQRMTDLQSQTVSSELKFLKSQINPHFLFNTLNNLYALTLKKSEKAPEVVVKLSNMMRYMLYECNEARVPLKKEIEYLKNYIDLESLRQSEDVEINFNVEGDLKNQEVAPLIFVPFLENAFKHGLKENIQKGFLEINLDISDKHIEMKISNSKPTGLLGSERKQAGGIGLENVRRRLDLLYPEKYDLNVDDSPKIYSTKLSLLLT